MSSADDRRTLQIRENHNIIPMVVYHNNILCAPFINILYFSLFVLVYMVHASIHMVDINYGLYCV